MEKLCKKTRRANKRPRRIKSGINLEIRRSQCYQNPGWAQRGKEEEVASENGLEIALGAAGSPTGGKPGKRIEGCRVVMRKLPKAKGKAGVAAIHSKFTRSKKSSFIKGEGTGVR